MIQAATLSDPLEKPLRSSFNGLPKADKRFKASFKPLLKDLKAHVDLDLGPVENPTGNSTPTTLVGFLMNRVVPSGVKRRIRRKEITRYSGEIGRSPYFWHQFERNMIEKGFSPMLFLWFYQVLSHLLMDLDGF